MTPDTAAGNIVDERSNHQQFDDLDTPAILTLLDDPPPEASLPEETAPRRTSRRPPRA